MYAGQYLSTDFSLLYFMYRLNCKYQKCSKILFFKVKIFYKYLFSFPLYASFSLGSLFIKKNCLVPLSSWSYERQQYLFVTISRVCCSGSCEVSFCPFTSTAYASELKCTLRSWIFYFLGLVTMQYFKLEPQRTGFIPLIGIS